MELKCQHCGYEWTYKGHSEFYATCPRCRNMVRVTHTVTETKDKKVKA